MATTTSTALLTDRYELTMLEAALASGLADRRATFELFARRLPVGRRYGVAVGLGRLVDAIQAFRFGPGELDALRAQGLDGPALLERLAAYEFRGDVHAYAEGEAFFPGSPVVTVEAPFGEGVLLETVALSILNQDSAVGAAAARMRSAAGRRSLIEMGSRRTGERSAPSAARAAYACGFDASSNLEAGRRFGVPTRGTAAHAFTLAHVGLHPGDEAAAERAGFAAQIAAQGVGTTLLVDTFDTARGLRHAVEAARAAGHPGPGAVRIDSGDPEAEARRARAFLDAEGATATRIVITGDLDEYAIAELADAPVDAYGAGTRVVQGSGHPTAGFVYKLVAIDDGTGRMVPVAKASTSKASRGGRKAAWRRLDGDGVAVEEVLAVDGPPPDGPHRPLQVPVIVGGEVVHRPSLDEVRAHHRASLAELPPPALDVSAGEPAIPTAHRS